MCHGCWAASLICCRVLSLQIPCWQSNRRKRKNVVAQNHTFLNIVGFAPSKANDKLCYVVVYPMCLIQPLRLSVFIWVWLSGLYVCLCSVAFTLASVMLAKCKSACFGHIRSLHGHDCYRLAAKFLRVQLSNSGWTVGFVVRR